MEPLLVLVIVLVSLVYFPMMIFSLLLNGSIMVVYLLTPKLRTPINLIVVHLSFVSIIPAILSPFTLVAFFQVMVSCSCHSLYYRWIFWQIFLFGIYPFNVVLLTISYLLVIKFSGKFLTFKKVVIGIVVIWALSVAFNLPTPFATPPSDYINCCETVCTNGSAICDTSTSFKTFTPRILTQTGIKYYNYRDLVVLLLPTAIIFVASAGSYYIFRRASLNSTVELELRMLLLPIIMTVSGGVFFLVEDIINWIDTAVDDERFPGVTVYATIHLFWDTAGVTFGLIVLFFNVSIRQLIYQSIVDRFQALRSRKDKIDVEKSATAVSTNVYALEDK